MLALILLILPALSAATPNPYSPFPYPLPNITNAPYVGDCNSYSHIFSTPVSTTLTHELYGFTPYSANDNVLAAIRKTCTFNTEISIESGWKVRVNGEADINGYSRLVANETLRFRGSMTFDEGDSVQVGPIIVRGPLIGAFAQHANASSRSVESDCGGGMLNVWYEAKVGDETLDPPQSDQPNPYNDMWTIRTALEVIRCE